MALLLRLSVSDNMLWCFRFAPFRFIVLFVLSVVNAQGFAANIVISNERSGDLVFMNESGDITDVVPLCNRPRGMARGTSNTSLFIACSDDNTVVEFDVTSQSVIRVFLDLPGAMSLAVHPPSGRLFITNEGAAKATVLDMETGEVLAIMPTGLEPDGIVVDQNGGKIFIASENAGMVHVFDGKSYQSTGSLITNLRPRRLAIREDEIWVSSEMGSRVEIFDTSTLQKTDEVIFSPKGFRSEQLTPVDILFDATGAMAFIALGSANHVVFVDANTREIDKYILVGRRPWGLAISPDNKQLYVLNGLSDDVTVIDVEKRRPVRTSRTGLVPHSVEIIH